MTYIHNLNWIKFIPDITFVQLLLLDLALRIRLHVTSIYSSLVALMAIVRISRPSRLSQQSPSTKYPIG